MREDLNERQRIYLEALFHADQAAEEGNRGAWRRGEDRKPAAVFRRIPYDNGPLGSQTSLQITLSGKGVYDSGAGATWHALAARALVKVHHYQAQTALGPVPCIDVEITSKGRKLIRARLGEKVPRKLPAGTLREWHWKAMARAYHAGAHGVPRCLNREWEEAVGAGSLPKDDDWGSGEYGGIGWNTWLRLRDYKAGALVEEFKAKWRELGHSIEAIYRIRLTPFGRELYRREHARYRELYPEVDAPAPAAEGEDTGSPGRDEPC
jgi:hypothetical protein